MDKSAKRARFQIVATMLSLCLLVAACGQSPNSSMNSTTLHPDAESTPTSSTADATATDEVTQYLADLQDWRSVYWDRVDAGAFTFDDPLAPTGQEIERAQAMVDQQLASVDALRLITAPPALTAIHAQYVEAITGEAQAAQRMVEVIRTASWGDMDLVMGALNEARALEVAAMADLEEYLTTCGVIPASQAGEEELVTYSDAELGFSIRYPKSWIEYPSLLEGLGLHAEATGLAIGDPSHGKFGTMPANYIILGAGPYDPKADGSSIEALRHDLAERSEEYEILKPAREINLNGLDAEEATATISPQGHTLMLRTVYAHAGTVSFIIQLCAEAAVWEAESAVFEAVLESLTVDAAT